ncbi:MAG: hypothetical protein H3C62_01320 [Gemmatimonadaceae bacterium]|nr:hypothetical protein [Gemmatimonadaceae bacterium]
MPEPSNAQVPVLSASEWGDYVRHESQLYIEAVSAELAAQGVPPARTVRDATLQRVTLLYQELHDSLVEFGVRSEVATIALRQITERPPDERLGRLESCVAHMRFLPSVGELHVLRVRDALHVALRRSAAQ